MTASYKFQVVTMTFLISLTASTIRLSVNTAMRVTFLFCPTAIHNSVFTTLIVFSRLWIRRQVKCTWQALNLSPNLEVCCPDLVALISLPHHCPSIFPLSSLARSACLLRISLRSLSSMHKVVEGWNSCREYSRLVLDPRERSWPARFLPDFDGSSPCDKNLLRILLMTFFLCWCIRDTTTSSLC